MAKTATINPLDYSFDEIEIAETLLSLKNNPTVTNNKDVQKSLINMIGSSYYPVFELLARYFARWRKDGPTIEKMLFRYAIVYAYMVDKTPKHEEIDELNERLGKGGIGIDMDFLENGQLSNSSNNPLVRFFNEGHIPQEEGILKDPKLSKAAKKLLINGINFFTPSTNISLFFGDDNNNAKRFDLIAAKAVAESDSWEPVKFRVRLDEDNARLMMRYINAEYDGKNQRKEKPDRADDIILLMLHIINALITNEKNYRKKTHRYISNGQLDLKSIGYYKIVLFTNKPSFARLSDSFFDESTMSLKWNQMTEGDITFDYSRGDSNTMIRCILRSGKRAGIYPGHNRGITGNESTVNPFQY